MKWPGTITVGVVAITLISCLGGPRRINENKSVFRYNESAGISSLDPAFGRYVENNRALNHLFNGLVQMDSNLNIKPCIAADWDVSEDGKIYTFFLRRDVYFHAHPSFPGGKPRKVTAKDFVYSFLRLVDAKTASPGSWIFSAVDDAQLSHLGFEAPEKYTFRIHLKEAFQPFLGMLTMKYCSVVPHEVVEELGKDFRNKPIGTGPFMFQQWEEGNKLVLLRNEHYFEKNEDGEKLPYLDAVSISFIGDEEVEYLEFLKGNLDFLSGTNGSNFEFLELNGQLKEKYSSKFNMNTMPYLITVLVLSMSIPKYSVLR
ncbi:MAG: ABC transporter substrate-binding protein, partial [Vicingaceae bacterium]